MGGDRRLRELLRRKAALTAEIRRLELWDAMLRWLVDNPEEGEKRLVRTGYSLEDAVAAIKNRDDAFIDRLLEVGVVLSDGDHRSTSFKLS